MASSGAKAPQANTRSTGSATPTKSPGGHLVHQQTPPDTTPEIPSSTTAAS